MTEKHDYLDSGQPPRKLDIWRWREVYSPNGIAGLVRAAAKGKRFEEQECWRPQQQGKRLGRQPIMKEDERKGEDASKEGAEQIDTGKERI